MEIRCRTGTLARVQVQFAEGPDLFRSGTSYPRAFFDVFDGSGRKILSGYRDQPWLRDVRAILIEQTACPRHA